jgi:hypothetical protein
MLSGVLLHVIEAPNGIDYALNSGAYRNRRTHKVHYRAVLVAIEHFDDFATGQATAIEGLSAGCRVEGGAIEDYECSTVEDARFDDGACEAEK